jgi:hypothetical protein
MNNRGGSVQGHPKNATIARFRAEYARPNVWIFGSKKMPFDVLPSAKVTVSPSGATKKVNHDILVKSSA